MNRLIKFTGIILLIVVMVTACSRENKHSSEQKAIAILKLGSHEIIDKVEESIKDSLKHKYLKNISISTYNGNFDDTLLHQSAAQIINGNFDIVVPITTPASIVMANQIKNNQKMIFSFVSNPETIWGGSKNTKPNYITGASDKLDYKKNLHLIKKLFPNAIRIGYLVNISEENAKDGLFQVRKLSKDLNLSIITVDVNNPSDVANATRTIVSQVDVFLVGGDNTVVGGLGSLLNIATKHNKPVFAVENTSVKKGCIAAYGIDYTDLGKKTSEMIISVLEGKKISSVDINYFSETKLYLNKKMIDFYKIDTSDLNIYIEYN